MKFFFFAPNRITFLAFFFCFFFCNTYSQITLTADVTQGCYPLTVNFTSTCPGGYSYMWDFGDGSPNNYSSNSDTTHTYASAGYYWISFYVNDTSGNFMGQAYVTVEVLGAMDDFYISNDTICPGENVHFNSNINANSYLWLFDDGTSSTSPYPSRTFTTLGDHEVILVIDYQCGIDSISDTVWVDNSAIPEAGFGWWPTPICPSQPVNFYPYDNNGTTYSWDFGDGNTSTTKNPVHTYSTAGTFTATMSITNSCGNTANDTRTVEVENSSGIPNWVSINTNHTNCPGDRVHISTSGGYFAYVFNSGMGGSDSISESSIDYTYYDTGQYVVSVTIYDYCGNDSTLYDTIHVINNHGFQSNPWFNINAPDLVCPGQPVNMNAPCCFPTYVWNFGDGSATDSILNRDYSEHTYQNPGTYVISCTLYNNCGIDTAIYDTITVSNTAGFQNAGFSFDNIACPNSEVNFFASSGNQSYVWDFGDGSPSLTSSNYYVEKIYPDTGTYLVTLTMTNYCGQDTTLTGTMNISDNVPIDPNFNFYCHPNPVCPGDEASLNTDNGFTHYEWDFGDGYSAVTSQDYAEHNYDSTGNYNASVTVTNGCGYTATKNTTVTVTNNAPFQNIWWEISPMIACPGDQIKIDVENGLSSYFFEYGNGDTATSSNGELTISFDSAGTYPITVTVSNGCGNTKTMTNTVTVDPNNTYVDAEVMSFSQNVCPGDAFNLFFNDDGGINYVWVYDFGDGTIDTVYGTGGSHVYQDTGNYTITATATNSCGHSASSTYSVYVGNSNAPTIFAGVPDGSDVSCPGDAVVLLFLGDYPNHNWDFGDGTTGQAGSQVNTPWGIYSVTTHVYADTGLYTPTLTITNNCGISATESFDITISEGGLVAGDILLVPPVNGNTYTTCDGVEFISTGGSSYTWDFGDGNTLTTLNSIVKNYYSNPGTYNVSVTITNGCGNTNTLSLTITVYDGGGATATTSLISSPSCNGSSNAAALVTASGGTPPYYFEWDDPLYQTGDTASGLSAGPYYITITDANGCSGITSVTIPVTPPISGVGNTVPANCGVADGSIVVTGVSGGTSPYTYSWSNGDSSPTADSLAAGTYSVTITDFSGCSSSQSIVLNDNGGVTISSATLNPTSCFGDFDGSIDITITGGTSPYSYEWSNGETTEDISGLFAGTYVVTVTDAIGCKTIQSGVINEPDMLDIQNNTTDANCGFADGAINVTPSGGTSPYTYNWSNGGSTNSLSGLVAGAYVVTISDSNSCTETFTVNVSNANAPQILDSITDISCNGNSDGAIDLTVIGGTTPYTYLWLHDGSFTQDVSNLDAGSYTIILNDGSGCQTALTFEILEPGSLTINASSTGAHCGYSDGSASLSVNGGSLPYSFSWQSGGTDSTETGLSSGSNSVTITDANGCIESTNITIDSKIEIQPICLVSVDSVTSNKNLIIWEKPIPALGIDSFHIYRDFLGTYVLIGTQPYSTESEFIDSTAGVNPNTTSYRYKLAAVDSCGNESDLSDFHETIHAQISANGTDVDMVWDNYEGFGFCCYNIMRDTSGIGNWHLLDQVSNNNFTYTDLNAPPGGSNYRIEVIPPDLCTANKEKDYNSAKSNTSAINIVGLAVSTTSTDATQAGSCDGTATVIASGGNSPYSYLWSDPNIQTTATATGLCPGTYSVIVTDSKGNIETASANVGLVQGFVELNNNGSMISIAPNPYSETTTISYTITETSEVELEVINLLGERITTLYKGSKDPGETSIKFSAKEVGYGAGIYTIRLTVNGTILTKRLIELR